MSSLLIRGGTVVRPAGDERADLLMEDGRILEVLKRTTGPQKFPGADHTIDAAGALLFPGFIDCHVHLREPGLEQKATMETECQSALMGGVSTMCDMPNTIPPTVTVEALREKVRIADAVEGSDIRFFFGITEMGHIDELRRVCAAPELQVLRARLCGVKIFLDHSTGNQKVAGELLGEIFRTCAELRLPVAAHCEDSVLNARAAKLNSRDDIAAHSIVRAPESEEKAIAEAITLAKLSGARLHIAHLSTARGLAFVAQAKKDGLPVTCEVAPHHLFLTTEDYESLGVLGKMNPPLRAPEHGEALWGGIADGTVDCVASDHAPHTLAEKQTLPSLSAPSGVPGVGTMIPLLLTVAAGRWPHPRSRSAVHALRYTDVRRLCFDRPNEIFSLGRATIEAGVASPLVLVHPEEEWVLQGSALRSKCGWTPYEGWRITGKITVIGR